MILSLTVAVLVTGGVYLLLQRSMVRMVFGVALLGYAANFVLLGAGVVAWRGEPLARDKGVAVPGSADPLPQAFVLTAIVITLAVTVLMLAMAVVGHNDDTHRNPDLGEGHGQ